jgi:uncharacterized protein (DUF1697 family)
MVSLCAFWCGRLSIVRMTTYVGLLRAVNLGGDSTLAMADLVSICQEAGSTNVRTYIASGNVTFESDLSEVAAASAIVGALQEKTGKKIGVIVRTGAHFRAVLEGNPFLDRPPNQVGALFVDTPLPAEPMTGLTGHKDEQVVLGERVIYVFYPDGMGKSRLKIPYASKGTMRNMNTVAKLADMAGR